MPKKGAGPGIPRLGTNVLETLPCLPPHPPPPCHLCPGWAVLTTLPQLSVSVLLILSFSAYRSISHGGLASSPLALDSTYNCCMLLVFTSICCATYSCILWLVLVCALKGDRTPNVSVWNDALTNGATRLGLCGSAILDGSSDPA